MKVLDIDFYQREDVLSVSKELIGKVLCTSIDGNLTKGIITETEAYAGVTDMASHAFGNRRTPRTETMFKAGGIAYIYLCYGIHHLFNVVTSVDNDPKATLVRGIEPLLGDDIMRQRRRKKQSDKLTTGGPATLTQALGLHTRMDREPLTGKRIWIEDHGYVPNPQHIKTGPRIGVEYAGEAAKWPYRFLYTAKFQTT